ncbi:hypothetical protein HYV81_03640 [Candidatus Woesearchaeota archaeon]|nr:hypothetical protein [Candidatus Woesearchaeota archaeon]
MVTLKEFLGNRKISTETWDTFEVLDVHPSELEIKLVERPYPEPDAARRARFEYFKEVELPNTLTWLERRSARLSDGRQFFIGEYKKVSENAVPLALFERLPNGEAKRMNYDGDQHVNLHQIVRSDDGVRLEVYQILYSEWMACKSRRFTAAYDAIGKRPGAGIGINETIESSDEFFIGTQRPIDTTNYPGTVFAVGGALPPMNTFAQAIYQQKLQEIGLKPILKPEDPDYDPKAEAHYNPDESRVLIIGSDMYYGGGAHPRLEIAGYSKARISFKRIIQLQKTTPGQTDVSGLVIFPTTPVEFTSRVAIMGATGELLTTGEMSLAYAFLAKRLQETGPEIANKDYETLNRMLNLYKRTEFLIPEIKG